MSDAAVILGKFVGVKTVASRDVAALTIEVPLTDLEGVITRLGSPSSAEDRWVAVARVTSIAARGAAAKPARVKRRWAETSVVERAGIMANDPVWQAAIKAKDADEAAAYIRRMCKVESRRDISESDAAMKVFEALERGYFEIKRDAP